MSIDHHLQGSIIDALWAGERTFSELKPDAIENSLFMYHLRKLIARGIVEKTDKAYQLTPEGARWAHAQDTTYRPLASPRTLIQLFVVRGDMVLISERQGVSGSHMNRYLLPAGLHTFGKSSIECADEIAQTLGVTRGALLTQVETIMSSHQLHVLSDIYLCSRGDSATPPDETYYHYSWRPLTEVAEMQPHEAGSLPSIVRGYLAQDLPPQNLIRME